MGLISEDDELDTCQTAYDFLLATRLSREANTFRFRHQIMQWLISQHSGDTQADLKKKICFTDRIALKSDSKHFRKKSIDQLLESRLSARGFSATPIRLVQLANVLQFSYGKSKTRIGRRTCASGGGLYPLEIYVFARNVESLNPGIYRWNPEETLLETIKLDLNDGDFDRLVSAEMFQEPALPAAGILISAVFQRSMRKYGPRGMRFIFLEAGQLGGQIHLVSEALGLGSTFCGGTCEGELEQLIGIDGVNEGLVSTILIGNPA